MANEFDDIFKKAAADFNPGAPKGLWQKISYELNAARGARQLNWVWPLRFAISFIAIVTVGLETARNYDSLALPTPGEPVNYEELAVEMKLLKPVENNEVEAHDHTSEDLLEGESVPRTDQSATSTTTVQPLLTSKQTDTSSETDFEKTQNVSLHSEVITKPILLETNGLEIASTSLNLAPSSPDFHYLHETTTLKPMRNWYLELGGFVEAGDVSFDHDYVLSVYDYEDELFSYIPNNRLSDVQNVTQQRMLSIVAGYRLSSNLSIYSGVRINYLAGRQTTILNVEEQFAYTVTRTYAGPSGFDRIQIEEEVVEATTVKDTISTQFNFTSWSIPLGINLNIPLSQRTSLFLGPQMHLALGYKYESSSSSQQFENLSRTIVRQEYTTPTSLSMGAVAGVSYNFNRKFELTLSGEAAHSVLLNSDTPISKSFGLGRLGLGLRYNF